MLKPEVIYEEKNFIAVNKPAGLLTHRAASHNEPSVADWAARRYPEIAGVGDDPHLRPGIVHRLDRDTSGILLIARNQEYFLYLKSLFAGRAMKKTYLAWVRGTLAKRKGLIDKPIGLKSGTVKHSVHSAKLAKEAITEYVVRKTANNADGEPCALLEVTPLTGRTHQIRVHLASIGHPIIGDPLYGKKSKSSRLMLHAVSLEFTTKEGERMKLEAPPPEAFENFG